jgi:hypothetical protein
MSENPAERTSATDTSTDASDALAEAGDQWVFVIDPAWKAAGEDDRPPMEAVLGGWFVEADGTTGRFHANPAYEPSSPSSPTDPVDATLQLVIRGEAQVDQLLSTMRETVVGLALDEQNQAVVAAAPDDVPSVLVTTAPAHRRRVRAVAGWVELSAEELADLLPDEGVDVLLNPGAPSSMRLIAGVLKSSIGETRRQPAEEPAAERVGQ